MEYIIVYEHDIYKLIRLVNQRLSDGYSLQGGIAVCSKVYTHQCRDTGDSVESNIYYYQAMVRVRMVVEQKQYIVADLGSGS